MPIRRNCVRASRAAQRGIQWRVVWSIYRISPCFAHIDAQLQALSQPARYPDRCRLLISNEIYSFGSGSEPRLAFRWTLGSASCRPRGRLRPKFASRDLRVRWIFAINSRTGSLLAHHRRSPPMRRSWAHASLDKPAHLRLCHAQQEVRIWSRDCD